MFYDPKVLGPYCEALDPQLAFVAYKKGAGECDDELIGISQKHGLFRDLARYLVERQDLELWARVLKKEDGEEQEHAARREDGYPTTRERASAEVAPRPRSGGLRGGGAGATLRWRLMDAGEWTPGLPLVAACLSLYGLPSNG